MTNTAQAILDYLKSHPPHEQIAERKDLNGLGTQQDIDAVLLELQDARVFQPGGTRADREPECTAPASPANS